MTIVGTAEIQITPNSSQFQSRLISGTQYGLNQLGNTAEQQAARGTKAFGLMYNTISTASLGAMEPVVGVVGNLENTLQALEGHANGILKTGLFAGGAGTAIGAGLQGLGSSEASNLAVLKGSVTNMGLVWSDYSGRVDEAVKTGERYGRTAANTFDALNRITVAAHSPTKALQAYTAVLNFAAERHIDLASAAQLYAQALGGNYSRLLKTVGINMTGYTKAISTQTSAQKAHATAVSQLAEKEKALRQEQERIKAASSSGPSPADQAAKIASAMAAVSSAEATLASVRFKSGPSSPQAAAAADRLAAAQARLAAAHQTTTGSTSSQVSQSIALKNAQDAVAAAKKKVTDTTKNLDTANRAAGPAQEHLKNWQTDFANRVKAGDKSMDSFSGHLHQLGAEIEDWAASFGNKWGPAITAGSVGLLAVSTMADLAGAAYGRWGLAGRQTAAMQSSLNEVVAVQQESFDAAQAAAIRLQEAQDLVAESEMALAEETPAVSAEMATSAETSAAAWTTASTTIDTELANMAAAGLVDMDEISTAAATAAAEAEAQWSTAAAGIEASLAGAAASGEADMAGVGVAAETAGAAGVAAMGALNTAVLGVGAGLAAFQFTTLGLNKLPKGAQNDIQQWIGHDVLHLRGNVVNPSTAVGSGTTDTLAKLGITPQMAAAMPRQELDQLVNSYLATHKQNQPASTHHHHHHQHHDRTSSGATRTSTADVLLGRGSATGSHSLADLLTGAIRTGHGTDRNTHMYLLRIAAASERQNHELQKLPAQIGSQLRRNFGSGITSPELATIR